MDKLILVLLDACGYEAASKSLAYPEHLADYELCAKYKVKGELPSLSRCMYATIFSGLPSCRHGITCNETFGRPNGENVFSLCRKAGGTNAAAAYGWFRELYGGAEKPFDLMHDRIQTDTDSDINYGMYYVNDAYPDDHLFADGEFLRNACKPDFLLIHTMGIDYAGHIYGSESKEYEFAVLNAGNILASLIPRWQDAGYQILITADHGMNEHGIHGGCDSMQRDVPLYIISDKVVPGRYENAQVSQLGIAGIMCRLLGIEPDKEMGPCDHVNWITN